MLYHNCNGPTRFDCHCYRRATKKIVPNYPITLQNTSRNILLNQISNNQGKAIFRNLEALDDYQVISELSNDFAAETSNLISIRSNQNPNLTLVLRKTLQLNEVILYQVLRPK
jgi:hypothetical protein